MQKERINKLIMQQPAEDFCIDKKGYYDVVTCLEVLEHVQVRRLWLRHVQNAKKDDFFFFLRLIEIPDHG